MKFGKKKSKSSEPTLTDLVMTSHINNEFRTVQEISDKHLHYTTGLFPATVAIGVYDKDIWRGFRYWVLAYPDFDPYNKPGLIRVKGVRINKYNIRGALFGKGRTAKKWINNPENQHIGKYYEFLKPDDKIIYVLKEKITEDMSHLRIKKP